MDTNPMNQPSADEQPTVAARPLARRTVIRGAAWTAPAVAVAIATPAAAASPVGGVATTIEITGGTDFDFADDPIAAFSFRVLDQLGDPVPPAVATLTLSASNTVRIYPFDSNRVDDRTASLITEDNGDGFVYLQALTAGSVTVTVTSGAASTAQVVTFS